MTLALIVLQVIVVIAVSVLLFRRPMAKEDSHLAALASADLPTRVTQFETRLDELVKDAKSARTQADSAASSLRSEVLTSINTLGDSLRSGVDSKVDALTERFATFSANTSQSFADNSSALQRVLKELGTEQRAEQEKLRGTVQERLDKLNKDNTDKLEEMRNVVDEKLQKSLHSRLTESFGQVTDQLTKVHAGLGEMGKLSAGVDDLSRIFTNVKARGTIGEVLLEALLRQMLAPSQFVKNPKVKPGTQELVEFAVKLPTPSGETLLPIDSKFPREVWERLETAYAAGVDFVSAGRAFETALRNEARKICDKYIAPPVTTSFGIMFLPTEGLYAEVMRRDGLQSDIQQNCHVTIAGPSTLSAILNSFQMGFQMLQLQRKGNDVWKVLATARKEFRTFEELMDKMSSDVGRVQGTIDKLGVRTRAINRSLRNVSEEASEITPLQPIESGMLPLLAAEEDE
jgi:DNA recombination protein RmuC